MRKGGCGKFSGGGRQGLWRRRSPPATSWTAPFLRATTARRRGPGIAAAGDGAAVAAIPPEHRAILLLTSRPLIREGLHSSSARLRRHVVDRGVRGGPVRNMLDDGLVADGDKPPVGAAGYGGHASHPQPCAEKLERTTAAPAACAALGAGCHRHSRADNVHDSLPVEGTNIVSNPPGARAKRVNHINRRGASHVLVVPVPPIYAHHDSFCPHGRWPGHRVLC